MKNIISLTALALCAAGPVFGAAEDGRFALKGAGRANCSTLIEARADRTTDYYLFAGWLDGYVSGINRYQGGVFDLTPWQTTELLMAFIDRACQASPDQRVIEVVDKLLKEFSPGRLTAESEIVTIKTGSKGLFIYREVMERAAIALREHGHETGEIGNNLSPQLSTALSEFQAANNLPETGLPDQQTLMRLFVRVTPSDK